MTPIEGTVLGASAAAIGWINWYFFIAGRHAARVAAGDGGRQDVVVRVDGGYQPSEIQVMAGRPVRLIFDRRDTSPCSEEVVLADFGMKRFLPETDHHGRVHARDARHLRVHLRHGHAARPHRRDAHGGPTWRTRHAACLRHDLRVVHDPRGEGLEGHARRGHATVNLLLETPGPLDDPAARSGPRGGAQAGYDAELPSLTSDDRRGRAAGSGAGRGVSRTAPEGPGQPGGGGLRDARLDAGDERRRRERPDHATATPTR